uniref:fatty acid-binding protein 5 n=1 Tax=Callospermophilus lateralis TaxID=76772 RepID=UPI004038DDFA
MATVQQLEGRWRLVDSKGFDDYMKELGEAPRLASVHNACNVACVWPFCPMSPSACWDPGWGRDARLLTIALATMRFLAAQHHAGSQLGARSARVSRDSGDVPPRGSPNPLLLLSPRRRDSLLALLPVLYLARPHPQGVGLTMRKMGAMAKPDCIITLDGQKLNIKTESTLKTTQFSCTLGEKFEETTADGRKTQTVCSFVDDALVQHQEWDGKESTITRKLKDGKLVVECVMNNVTCTRVYEKVE